MIRAVLILAGLAALFMVTYLPAKTPPEAFRQVLAQEHARYVEVLGHESAMRVLDRTTSLLQAPPKLGETPGHDKAVGTAAVAQHMNATVERFLHNAYFRSIDAQVALAAYRAIAVVEILPTLAIFAVICLVDGLVMRAVRARRFLDHKAEVFGLLVVAAITTVASAVVGLFAPVVLGPMMLVVAMLAACFFIGRAVSHYHMVV